MTAKFVDLEALNFRSSPNSSSLANRIGVLHLGQPVDEIGPAASAPDWLEIQAEINSVKTKGVVKAEINGLQSLRDPVSDPREALVAEAIKEWLRFEKGQGLEYVDPYYKFVGDMWEAIGQDLDGRDRGIPWSAAAISFMVRHAGVKFAKYKNFKFAAAHAHYMHDSIVQREANESGAPFWGFRLYEIKPEIGDIVCKWRGTERDYDDAKHSANFKSHSDIIVSVQPDYVLAIGGNVADSVNITQYEKTGTGFLAAKGNVFMIMGNKA